MVENKEETLLQAKLREYVTTTSQTTLGDLLIRYLYTKMPKTVITDIEKAALSGAKLTGYKEAMADISRLTQNK